jgi:hypothetical protein
LINFTRALFFQDAFVKRHGIKVGFMSAFVKASAYALRQQPVVNAVIDGGDIVYRDYVDISVAVATPKVELIRHSRPSSLRAFNSIDFFRVSSFLYLEMSMTWTTLKLRRALLSLEKRQSIIR